MLSQMFGQPRYLNHQYDRDGNREHLTHTNDGARFRYFYDGLGRVTHVADNPNVASPDDYVIRYFYRPEGPRYVAIRGAGAAGFTTAYHYDHVQRLTMMINDLPGAANDMTVTLGYNPASQIRHYGRDNDAFAWTGTVPASRAYTTNGQNQYLASGPTAFNYDANGNLIWDTASSYVYDVENRLVSASGDKSAHLIYDPLGRLAQINGPAGVTRFHYDGDRLVAEYDFHGNLLRRYVHGPGTDEPVAVYEGASLGLANRRYMLPDERGSIVALVNANGTPAAINTYNEYGVPGAEPVGRFGYTGQTWIPELGLWYYKARFYSSRLGRFLQVDPIGYDDQINLYAYVGNDPINKTDPSGLADVDYMNRYDKAYEQELGRDFDIRGTVTVMAHGSPISQHRSDGSWARPDSSAIAAAINKVSRSQPIFLGACSMVDGAVGLQQIAEISRLTGNRPIMASTGYIGWTKKRDGGTTLKAYHPRADRTPNPEVAAEFKVFNGSFADFGIRVRPGFSVTGFDVSKNGDITAVMSGFITGSRIRQTEYQKVK